MILSSHQPYFCPYPGYFAKIMDSDVFVILDSVQFPRGGTWITRNRFKNDQGVFWVGMPVWRKGRGLQRINEVRICHEAGSDRKRIESIKSAYAHAPYLEEHLPLFERLFSHECDRIGDADIEAIEHVVRYLGISTRIVLLSDLDIQEKGSSLITALCRSLGAS
ncbi:MAG TPA: WbqC family protein, partial [Deltaproteobacteria bacterium]|nr:WbqC family protein [Deltaproteobacteria bacterium]